MGQRGEGEMVKGMRKGQSGSKGSGTEVRQGQALLGKGTTLEERQQSIKGWMREWYVSYMPYYCRKEAEVRA